MFPKATKLNKVTLKFSNLGVVYKEQKDLKSIEYYLKSISMDPNDANTHLIWKLQIKGRFF